MNRVSHDQLFKQVLEAFFPDFLQLFDPATAARLDPMTPPTFRSTEVFTDIPQGERRRLPYIVLACGEYWTRSVPAK